jgi:hypothetical protein
MPGAPWMRGGAPMEERSTWKIVKVFIAFPILMGGIILAIVVGGAVERADKLTAQEWVFQVGTGSCLGLGALVVIPAVGIAELSGPARPARPPRRSRSPAASGAAGSDPAAGPILSYASGDAHPFALPTHADRPTQNH